MEREPPPRVERSGRGWPRAMGLLGVVLATSVLHPGVTIAVPLVLLLATEGPTRRGVIVAATLAVLVLATGSRDGMWFAERAWALLLGGWFLGLTMLTPESSVTSRSLAAVAGAGAVGTAVLLASPDAWVSLDAAIGAAVTAGVDATIGGWSMLTGDPLSPSLEATFREAAAAQVAVFPALVLLESTAALGVAWWARTRLVGEGDRGLGPLREFRFNDHLVWVLVAGLVLLVAQLGAGVARVGSNAVVFMSALYALRGLAVFMFFAGGLSLVGIVLFGALMMLAPPLVAGIAVLTGIGDTWLDVRRRVREGAA